MPCRIASSVKWYCPVDWAAARLPLPHSRDLAKRFACARSRSRENITRPTKMRTGDPVSDVKKNRQDSFPAQWLIANKSLGANDSHKDTLFPENPLSHPLGFTPTHHIKHAIDVRISVRQQSTIPFATFVIESRASSRVRRRAPSLPGRRPRRPHSSATCKLHRHCADSTRCADDDNPLFCMQLQRIHRRVGHQT